MVYKSIYKLEKRIEYIYKLEDKRPALEKEYKSLIEALREKAGQAEVDNLIKYLEEKK